MARFVATVKLGVNGVAISIRDVDTGRVFSFNMFGPRDIIEDLMKAMLRPPEFEVKWE